MAVGASNIADRKRRPQDRSRVGLQPQRPNPSGPPLPGTPPTLKVLLFPEMVPTPAEAWVFEHGSLWRNADVQNSSGVAFTCPFPTIVTPTPDNMPPL